jgi:hypothetical protein
LFVFSQQIHAGFFPRMTRLDTARLMRRERLCRTGRFMSHSIKGAISTLGRKMRVCGLAQELTKKRRNTTKLRGDAVLVDLERTLDSFGYTRSVDQKIFHTAFVEACLPHLYGDEWPSACARVLTERKLERLQPEVLCITPRRWGKTWSVAMFVCAMMMCVPGIRIAIFSTGKRASSNLTDTIREFLELLPAFKYAKIMKSNQEKLFVAPNANHTKKPSQLHSFPSVTSGKKASLRAAPRHYFLSVNVRSK